MLLEKVKPQKKRLLEIQNGIRTIGNELSQITLL